MDAVIKVLNKDQRDKSPGSSADRGLELKIWQDIVTAQTISQCCVEKYEKSRAIIGTNKEECNTYFYK